MNEILRAVGRALRSLLHIKILILAILPTLLAALFWTSLALHFWPELNAWLAAWLDGSILVRAVRYLARWAFASDAAGFVPLLAKLVIMAITLPLIQATSLLLTAICAMPLMVRHVAARSYPALERRHGGNFLHSVINGVLGSLMFVILWVLTLPLWFVPGVVFVLPAVLSAYLNQRLFCYDAIADHADARELHAILHAHRLARYSLGAIGVVHYIPLLGWFAPVLTGLAFIHWGLARIALMRHLEAGSETQ